MFLFTGDDGLPIGIANPGSPDYDLDTQKPVGRLI
jgi:hypothetical protein